MKKRTPKYKLEYTFETKDDFNHAVKGIDYYCALCEFDQRLRSLTKYSENDDGGLWAQKARDLFWEVMGEEKIELYI